MTASTYLRWTALMIFLMLATRGWADSPGRNGARSVTAAGIVVNQYTTLVAGVAAGATSITVASSAALTSTDTGGGALTAGDVILIYQATGATIDTGNTIAYGGISSYGNAGNYEMRSVRSVAGNVIQLDSDTSNGTCTVGLKRGFNSGAQVVRVPQYSTLSVTAGSSITPNAWNGSTGGVIAIMVQDNALIDGTVTAAGLGFRGGILDNSDRSSGATDNINFATDDNPAGGQKGEGIASGAGGIFGGLTLSFSNPGGNFDMSAAANAGGGGGSHNSGGGGGANGGLTITPYCTAGSSTFSAATTATTVWCGQGTMPTSTTGSVAWQLDPAYAANGNARTAHAGGGRGGYTFSGNSNINPTTSGPGLVAWGGNNRRSMGGWGGRPLTQSLSQRLFFGGGGGAGASNSGPMGGAGGPGGGIAILIAGSISGSGTIDTSGARGVNTTGVANDAPGGGGGGGSALVYATTISGISMLASGGAGGNQTINGTEAEGPGGGGGGGVLAVSGGTPTRIADGAAGGFTSSSPMINFPRNGATDGAAGDSTAVAPNLLPSYRPCTVLQLSKSNGVTTVTAGAGTTYVLTVTNAGPSAANNSVLTDPAATGLSCNSVNCTAAFSGASCPSAGSTTMAYLQGAGITLPTLPSGSSLTFSLGCGVTATGQ